MWIDFETLKHPVEGALYLARFHGSDDWADPIGIVVWTTDEDNVRRWFSFDYYLEIENAFRVYDHPIQREPINYAELSGN